MELVDSQLHSLKRSSLLNANEYIFIDHRDKRPPTSANADCAKYPLVRNFIHIINVDVSSATQSDTICRSIGGGNGYIDNILSNASNHTHLGLFWKHHFTLFCTSIRETEDRNKWENTSHDRCTALQSGGNSSDTEIAPSLAQLIAISVSIAIKLLQYIYFPSPLCNN